MSIFRTILVTLVALLASLVATSGAFAATAPTITAVNLGMPTTTDPAMPPSQKFVSVSLTVTLPEGCPGIEFFRYANEDGIWKTEPVSRTRPYIQPSAGYGYKGVFVQLVGSCIRDSGIYRPIGNIVYKRYTLARPDAQSDVAPTITAVSVALPTTNDPAAAPADRLPRAYITATVPQGCTVSEFRYANEDGIWKATPVSRTLGYIHPTAGYGYKGVFVQLWGTCIDGGKSGPIGNVVYKRYTLARL